MLWSTRFLEIDTEIPWSLFSNVKMRIFTWIKLAVQSFNVWLATCIPVQLATLFKEYGKHGILTGNVLKFKPLLDNKGQKTVDYELPEGHLVISKRIITVPCWFEIFNNHNQYGSKVLSCIST